MTMQGRATAQGLVAILIWSSFAVLTSATEGIPPFQLMSLSFACAGIAGLAWTVRNGVSALRVLRQPLVVWALIVGAYFGYHALYFAALKRAPVVEASLINYLWPLLIVVFAAFLPGSRARAGQFVGAFLGLAAAVLVVTRGAAFVPQPEHTVGYVCALGAALTWSAYSVVNRRFGEVPTEVLAGASAVVSLLAAIAHLRFEQTVTASPSQWLAIVAIGLGPSGVAFWLWDAGTKRGDIALLGALSYAAPVLSTALLLLFGRATAHWSQAAAVALLLAGAWISVRSSAQGNSATQQPRAPAEAG